MAVNIGGSDTANSGQAAARAQALARGYTPAEVDAFIAKEGGERTSTSRILTAFAPRDASGQGTATPSNQSAEGLALNNGAGGGSTSGGDGAAGFGGFGEGGPVGGVPPSVQKAALTGLSAGDQTGIGASAAGGGGGGVSNAFQVGGPSSLRQNLGNRIYPQESSALAGLRKAY